MLTCHCLYPCVRYVNMLVSSCSQVLLSWKPVNSYGDAFLIGYQLFHNGKPNETMFTPDVLQATISQLKPGNLCISIPCTTPVSEVSFLSNLILILSPTSIMELGSRTELGKTTNQSGVVS